MVILIAKLCDRNRVKYKDQKLRNLLCQKGGPGFLFSDAFLHSDTWFFIGSLILSKFEF